MDRLTVVRSLTHPYPLHGTVYAMTGIPDVDTKIEAQPRHKRQWPFIGSLVDYFEDKRTSGKLPEMPRNVALPFAMGSKNEIPPLAGPYGAMLGMRYDPVYTNFTGEGTVLAPELVAGKAFKDPFLGIKPTDKLQLGGAGLRKKTRRGLICAAVYSNSSIRRGETWRPTSGSGPSVSSSKWPFRCLTSGKMHAALDYTREPMRGSRVVWHDAVRPILPGGPTADRSGFQIRHRDLGCLRSECRFVGHAPQSLWPVEGIPAAGLRPHLQRADSGPGAARPAGRNAGSGDQRARSHAEDRLQAQGSGPAPLVARVFPGLRRRRHGARQPRRPHRQTSRGMSRRRRSHRRTCSRPRSICWASIRKARSPIRKAAPCRSPGPGFSGRNFWDEAMGKPRPPMSITRNQVRRNAFR